MEGSTEKEEEIVIVGAGIAGLTTALGLHRLGMKSIVLECCESLRTSGFAFTTWQNGWRALDAVGVGDSLRHHQKLLLGIRTFSAVSGLLTSERSFDDKDNETRCVERKRVVETLAAELPSGTIRYSSKVVSIQEEDVSSDQDSHHNYSNCKLIHLADASIIRAKVLIGADGVNSVVAKWLGLKTPTFTGRAAIRGTTVYEHGHGFDPIYLQFFGDGVRFGVIPCDDNTLYWFFTWSPSSQEMEEIEELGGGKMKEFVVSKIRGAKVGEKVRGVFEDTNPDNIIISPLTFRNPIAWPLQLLHASKGNVCVAGDAFHPMTPDIGQGACSALEDAVVLARCLAQALNNTTSSIEIGLNNYARERKWRAFQLITTSYLVGYIQQTSGKLLGFFRDNVLAGFLAAKLLKMSTFDCGTLYLD